MQSNSINNKKYFIINDNKKANIFKQKYKIFKLKFWIWY